jgi:hypothetical protein
MSELAVETPSYRLELRPDGLLVRLSAPDGEPLAELRPLTAADTTAAPDESLAVSAPVPLPGADPTFRVVRRSTVWEEAGVDVVCTQETVELRPWVRGRGALADVHLLAFRSLVPGQPLGYMPSGRRFRSLFSPNPGDPLLVVRSAGESAVIGVAGDGTPGRGHWLFTPAPLVLAVTTAADADPNADLAEGWLSLAVEAPVADLRFVQVEYVPGDGSFALRLDYEGHTQVDGELRLPSLVLTPGLRTPYGAIGRHRERLRAGGLAPAAARPQPSWWREPIFCGWGAQCELARDTGRFAGAFATQENYDAFIAHLASQGLEPGIVVLDDKWQEAYGTNRPDTEKWPDLAGWIERRHARGQHVLLWWKAWDPEGLPPELCIRNPDGTPVAFDPTNPEALAELRAQLHRLLGRDGVDADGLKIDFTARTPSGRALATSGDGWGIALLHELLRTVYTAAKEAKPDALVITHAPHPAFADVTDMIRLNDVVRAGDDPRGRVVAQMRHRAQVARTACPELLVDTDDWCVPSLEEWREYAEAKPGLGVPSLYYAWALDATGERFEERDYETLRRTWGEWRAAG